MKNKELMNPSEIISEFERRLDLFYKKACYFKENKVVIHIKKSDGRVHNGEILEINREFLILDDIYTQATPIYFLEIEDLNVYKEKKK